MPTSNSAKKRMRTAAKSQARNAAVKSRVGTTRRRLYDAIDAGDKAAMETQFRSYCSLLDKAVKKGTIKANNASRRKSRASHRMAGVS
jgi:small subunit ribosomal protein S20